MPSDVKAFISIQNVLQKRMETHNPVLLTFTAVLVTLKRLLVIFQASTADIFEFTADIYCGTADIGAGVMSAVEERALRGRSGEAGGPGTRFCLAGRQEAGQSCLAGRQGWCSLAPAAGYCWHWLCGTQGVLKAELSPRGGWNMQVNGILLACIRCRIVSRYALYDTDLHDRPTHEENVPANWANATDEYHGPT